MEDVEILKSEILATRKHIDFEESNLDLWRKELARMIGELQDICTHNISTVAKSLDYDSNEYTVKCVGCEKTLLNYGSYYGYQTFKDGYGGKIIGN